MLKPERSLMLALAEIVDERERQDAKWGEQNHPDGTGGPVMQSRADEARAQCQFLAEHGGPDWRAILLEEVYEALAEEDPAKLRTELVQTAAVVVAWIQAIDRRVRETRPCQNESEPDGVPCTGTLTFEPGEPQAKCPSCGAWEGVLARPRATGTPEVAGG